MAASNVVANTAPIPSFFFIVIYSLPLFFYSRGRDKQTLSTLKVIISRLCILVPNLV
jgi:hypothetical protein